MTSVHPSAVVHPQAKISPQCEIGPYCVIGENVTLGDGCKLHSHVVMMAILNWAVETKYSRSPASG